MSFSFLKILTTNYAIIDHNMYKEDLALKNKLVFIYDRPNQITVFRSPQINLW